MAERIDADLVLVGGGHTHVQVLRRWMMRPLPGVRVTAVLDRAEAVYSGMVPGFAAGDYAAGELEIDVVPLARRARARVVLAAATRVDPAERRIELAGRAPIAYDVASLDVGSSVRGLELPGVREHALATRPIRSFVDRLEAQLARARDARGDAPLRLVVVGAGAAGMELAFTVQRRLEAAGVRAELVVLAASGDVLPGHPANVSARARALAERRGIRVRCGVRAVAVEKDALHVEPIAESEGDSESERLPCDLALWATGAAPQALIADSPLPRDPGGFVRVHPTLQVVGFDDLFAAGDAAALEADPWVPKAGVYAVRQGPILDRNLRARLSGARLRRYRPQRDYLMLLNLGGREALGAKWGVALRGAAVWRLKDWIDRRFVRRFRVLEDGVPAPDFPSPEAMGMGADAEEMTCGGCAAKLAEPVLARALARLGPPPPDESVLLGLERPDDAAAMALPRGDVLLATVDAFRAFADDPFLVGRVAAVNAISDVLAKGGRPRHALALVTVPEEHPLRAEETLYQALAGVRAALDPAGVSLVGGHTTSGEELFVGLTVTGEARSAEAILPLAGAKPGDALLLTKPLGTGVVLAADMRGLSTGAWLSGALASMQRSNDAAARVARDCGARAATDVSGFGLAGHLTALLRAGGVGARLRAAALPALDGALALLSRGARSTFHAQNARAGAVRVDPSLAGAPEVELVFDPQTSGGLLLAVAPERAPEALRALREEGDARAAAIGEVVARGGEGAPRIELVP